MTTWLDRSEQLGGEVLRWEERASPVRPGVVEMRYPHYLGEFRISGRVGADPSRSGSMPEVFRSGGTSAIRERGSSRRTPTATRSRPSAPALARMPAASRVRVFIRPEAADQLYRCRLTDGLDDLAILETGGAILGKRSGSDFIVTGFSEDLTAKRSPTSLAISRKHMLAAGDELIGNFHTHPRHLHNSRVRKQYSGPDVESWRSSAEEFGKSEWLGVIVSPTMTEYGQYELSKAAWESLSLDAYTCTSNGTVTPVPIESY